MNVNPIDRIARFAKIAGVNSKGRHYNATQKLVTQYVSTSHRRKTTYVDPDHKTYWKTLILSITGEVVLVSPNSAYETGR